MALTGKEILALPMQRNDAGARTVKDYLIGLAEQVWILDEGFSGKRPYGNSGWKIEVKAAVVRGDPSLGTVIEDEDGYIEDVKADNQAVDRAVRSAIKALYE